MPKTTTEKPEPRGEKKKKKPRNAFRPSKYDETVMEKAAKGMRPGDLLPKSLVPFARLVCLILENEGWADKDNISGTGYLELGDLRRLAARARNFPMLNRELVAVQELFEEREDFYQIAEAKVRQPLGATPAYPRDDDYYWAGYDSPHPSRSAEPPEPDIPYTPEKFILVGGT